MDETGHEAKMSKSAAPEGSRGRVVFAQPHGAATRYDDGSSSFNAHFSDLHLPPPQKHLSAYFHGNVGCLFSAEKSGRVDAELEAVRNKAFQMT